MVLKSFVLTIAIMVLVISMSYASDSIPLQDFCVAINDPNNSHVSMNEKFCKNPKDVTADDFFISGLNIAANTSNQFGSVITAVYVDSLPGLNTLGLAFSRIDYISIKFFCFV
ncbi:hypothetical protein P3S68_010239 [Capsicum galapagoense]